MKIYIYGVFEGAICLYVGATSNPEGRWKNHRFKRFRDMPTAQMRVLRQTNDTDAGRIEWQVISAYHRKGQAAMNAKHKTNYSATYYGTPVRLIETGEVYRSIDFMARQVGCSAALITLAMRKRAGKLFCGTVERVL